MLLINRGLGRSAPAGDEIPSEYAAGAVRKRSTPELPQDEFAALFPVPLIERTSPVGVGDGVPVGGGLVLCPLNEFSRLTTSSASAGVHWPSPLTSMNPVAELTAMLVGYARIKLVPWQ